MDEYAYDCPNCGSAGSLVYRGEYDMRCSVCGYDFEAWLQMVEAVVLGTVGIGVHELADWPYAGAFVEGMDPTDAANEAMMADERARSILQQLFGDDASEDW